MPWYAVARQQIYPGILAKFQQNELLANYLINTGEKVIGESTTDKYWGVGMSLTNPNVLDKNHWQGKNIMGLVLQAVRAELVASK